MNNFVIMPAFEIVFPTVATTHQNQIFGLDSVSARTSISSAYKVSRPRTKESNTSLTKLLQSLPKAKDLEKTSVSSVSQPTA